MISGAVPSRETFQFCPPSTSYNLSNPPVMRRTMKRHSDFIGGEMDAPRNKRRYEDRMSSKLDNFHINDRTETSNVHVAEELQDWEVENDIGEQRCVIEEPSEETFNEVVLCEPYRSYFYAYKKQNDLSFLGKQVSGKELILYHPPRSITETVPGMNGDSISNRIVEVKDCPEADDDTRGNSDNQFVTFPEASSDSNSPNPSPPPQPAVDIVDVDDMDYNGNADAGNDDSMEID